MFTLNTSLTGGSAAPVISMKSLAPDVSQLDDGVSFVQQIESVKPANFVQSVGPLEVYGTCVLGSQMESGVSRERNQPAAQLPRSDLLRNVAEAKGANGKADVALTPFPSPADGIMLARGRTWVKQQKKKGL